MGTSTTHNSFGAVDGIEIGEGFCYLVVPFGAKKERYHHGQAM
jgi:hypothetical protein